MIFSGFFCEKGFVMSDNEALVPECGTRESEIVGELAEKLCAPDSLNDVWRRMPPNWTMPSPPALAEIMERLRAAIFPGYFGPSMPHKSSMRFHLAANLDSILHLLAGQLTAGLCFGCAGSGEPCATCGEQGRATAIAFMRELPEIRRLLASDARAAYEGDPAARSVGETIFCYPSITAMLHHRVAHALYRLNAPIVPRIISEMAHSLTGIDINPGASIGEDFFIDHGTGVVIGETCVIGRGCRLYQGVTLGALSFPRNADGTLTKGIPRHPLLEDNVTVYAGATILGRVTIGRGAVIGGNVWITRDVSPGARISQRECAGARQCDC